MNVADRQVGLALRVVDDAWSELSRTHQAGLRAFGLPHVSPEAAHRRSTVGHGLLARIAEVDIDALPAELALTVEVARWRASGWTEEEGWYWTAFDPSGVGFFALFAATAYSGGFMLNGFVAGLQRFPFTQDSDCDRYLALISDYARLVGELAERTRGQTKRGIRMPKVQAAAAAPLIAGLKAHSLAGLGVTGDRLTGVTAGEFSAELERRLGAFVAPAFDDFLAEFGADYLEAAPEAVGMAQYPMGPEIYAALVKSHTTLDLTPRAVQEIGLERMESIRAQMAEAVAADGFDGDALAYRARLNADERWRAKDAEGVQQFFQTYIDRIQPKLEANFSFGPKAPYGAHPLPEALEASMTFGYYDMPKPGRPEGYFLFNTRNLTQTGLFNIGPLTYHELVPGHHFHFSTQQENAALHPLRSHSFFNAYNEGWAEYAATLAGEMGLYATPAERFGRLVMDAFLTCRLVVDTGMNAFGWTLERAQQYLRENSFMSETEIRSESLRYSCDIPGQALAYKLGDSEILKMRERMRAALGNRFDIRQFHAAVLGPGGLPLPLLAAHVARETERLAALAQREM